MGGQVKLIASILLLSVCAWGQTRDYDLNHIISASCVDALGKPLACKLADPLHVICPKDYGPVSDSPEVGYVCVKFKPKPVAKKKVQRKQGIPEPPKDYLPDEFHWIIDCTKTQPVGGDEGWDCIKSPPLIDQKKSAEPGYWLGHFWYDGC